MVYHFLNNAGETYLHGLKISENIDIEHVFQSKAFFNKKPTFLACNLEHVYAAILEYSKNNDLFQNRQTYFRQILEIFRNFLDMVSVRLASCVRVKGQE